MICLPFNKLCRQMIAQYLKAAHQEQAAAEGFCVADAVIKQLGHPRRITYAQHAFKRDGDKLAASIALAEIDRRVGQNIDSFNLTRVGELARNSFAMRTIRIALRRRVIFVIALHCEL
jgi:hypothetical protein